MAEPYKAARPCSDLAAPPLLGNLSPHSGSPLGNPARTEVRRGVGGGRRVEAERRGGCRPPLRTFLSEALPLEAGSSILPVADRCCTVVVAVIAVVVVAIVVCCSRLCHRCTGCHRGTSAGA